jgi:hypothetical protein
MVHTEREMVVPEGDVRIGGALRQREKRKALTSSP